LRREVRFIALSVAAGVSNAIKLRINLFTLFIARDREGERA